MDVLDNGREAKFEKTQFVQE